MILFCITGTLGILCLLFCRKNSCILGCLIWIVCSFYLVVFLFYSLHRARRNLFLLASVRILVGRFVYVFLFRLWMSLFDCLLGWHCYRFLGRSSVRVGVETFSSVSFCSCTWVFQSVFRVLGSQMCSCLSEILWCYGHCRSIGFWECYLVVSFGILFGRLLTICLDRSVLLGKRVALSCRGLFCRECFYCIASF